MLVVEPVQAAIWHCLNHYGEQPHHAPQPQQFLHLPPSSAYGDATFLAERLLDESGTEEALHLAATCHYRAGRVRQAHHLLHSRGTRSPSTRFLLARCAADLRLDAEAELVLRGPPADARKEVRLDDMEKRFGERAAFALQILSSLYARTERPDKAADADRKALKLNPLLWRSFETLSLAGEVVDPETVWGTEVMEDLTHCTGTNPVMNLVNSSVASQRGTPALDTPRESKAGLSTLQTPTPAPPRPLLQLNDSSLSLGPGTPAQAGGMETPLLNYNSLASTPVASPMGAPLSGISSLNITADTSTECPSMPQYKLTAFMPPPLKPKARRQSTRGGPVKAFSPSFGTLGDTPSPAGVAAKLLEFSSPQVMLLSASSPILPAKAPLVSTPSQGAPPVPLPLRTSTPGAPPTPEPESRPVKVRVAMAAKPDNTKTNVVLAPSQTLANMITPSPVSLQPRRSSRLFGSTNTTTKENSKGPGKGRLKNKSRQMLQSNRQLSENELNEKNRLSDGKLERERISGELEPDHKPAKPSQGVNLPLEADKLQRASLRGLLQLLRQLGAAYQRVGRYDCRAAAALLGQLPPRHAGSAWVLATLGKCHFELNEYKEACAQFALVREKEPHRLELMEFYSTALWHLQEEVQLSALAQDLQRLDQSSAAAWCATGNCFSHQKEHENAIKFFQRAVQVGGIFGLVSLTLGTPGESWVRLRLHPPGPRVRARGGAREGARLLQVHRGHRHCDCSIDGASVIAGAGSGVCDVYAYWVCVGDCAGGCPGHVPLSRKVASHCNFLTQNCLASSCSIQYSINKTLLN